MEEADDEPEKVVNLEYRRDEVGGEASDDPLRVNEVRADDGTEGVGLWWNEWVGSSKEGGCESVTRGISAFEVEKGEKKGHLL
jgi:hypothetical protein